MSSLTNPRDALRRLEHTVRPNTARREFVLNPIAALAFYASSADAKLFLLAAEDNYISIFDVETSRLCGGIEVFSAQSVHGITVTPSGGVTQRILVWGGYSVAVVPIQAVESVIARDAGTNSGQPQVATAKASDWVFEGVISPHGTSDLALLTAHNDLIIARYDEKSGLIDLVDIASPSRPILYSGNLSWEEPGAILVAAGTVFGEIVVWKYSTVPQEHGSQCEVLFVFSGHEGSIFGVHISPLLNFETGENLRLLASCSDDRTIRVWDITDPRDLSGNAHDQYQKKIFAARETGFGDSIEATSQEQSSARCLAVAMGHISRIWQVEFRRQQRLSSNSPSIELWSFGEDATAQRWSLSLSNTSSRAETTTAAQTADLPTRTRGILKNEAIFANHSGKNIWSHAITFDKAGQLVVVTGASDGKIAIIGNRQRATTQQILDDVPSAPEKVSASEVVVVDKGATKEESKITEVSKSIDLPSQPSEAGTAPIAGGLATKQSSPKPTKKPKIKKPAKDFFNRCALLSDGSLLTSSKNGRFFVGNATNDSRWKELFPPDGHGNTSSTYAVVTGSFNSSNAFIGTAEGDIFAYCSADPLTLTHTARVHGKVSEFFPFSTSKLLVTVLGSESATLMIFDGSTNTPLKQMDVPVDKRFIVTSAALHENLIILGSRTGYISVLGTIDGGAYIPRALVEPRTNDCVTSISVLPVRGSEKVLNFLTTSRDGRYRIYTVQQDAEHFNIRLVHETSPPFGPIIEGAWFSENQDGVIDLILYGFRSTKFVVWNETKRREIAAIECGGGHRTFCYDPLPGSSEGFRLVWTQASRLCSFSQTHAPHITLKSGGHGREIKAISASGNLVATAAEDTAIRIWSYVGQGQCKPANLQCLAVLDNHTAGIQSMKWYKQSYLFSSGGNKEFFIWRLSRIDSKYQGLAVKCEDVYPDRTDDVDLRIMNFDVHCGNEASDEMPFFYISMVLSNSTLLTYTYSETAGFKLIAKGSYTGACMTQLRHFHVDDTTIQTFTAATDGHLAVWGARIRTGGDDTQISEYASLVVTKLHQSTMKSLDVRTASPGSGTSYLVVTGGDDNGLGAAHFFRDNISGIYTVKSRSVVRSAHAAAVTGIAVLNLTSNGEDAIVVSCSNDQRVKRWQIVNWQSEEVRVKLLDNRYSSIADPGDLEVLEEGRRFAVGGVGMEIWDAGREDDSMSREHLDDVV